MSSTTTTTEYWHCVTYRKTNLEEALPSRTSLTTIPYCLRWMPVA